MITAQQARELADKSGKEVNRILYLLEKEIQLAAIQGHEKLLCYKHVEWGAVPTWMCQPPVTYMQSKIIEKLTALGYQASMVFDGESYVPKGLADDGGEGPQHVNHVLLIRW